MNTHLVVREYDLLLLGERSRQDSVGAVLARPAFEALDALARGALSGVLTSTRQGAVPALKLGSHVGVLRTPDGTVIEVLPKTHERGDDAGASRALLLRMLAATDVRFRVAPPADLDPARMPLFEVFLRYTLEGFKAAIRRGVPHAYVTVEEERSGFRGRLHLSRQVRQPAHRAHLLHVQYDEYLPDRPETRLVRLSLERIQRMTVLDASRRLARELLLALEGVPPCVDVQRDLQAWRTDRGHAHFAPLEDLCRLVLHELNPLAGGSSSRALSVLFPMERVFEAYVAGRLRTQQPGWTVRTQVTEQALGDAQGRPAFPLRPDLHLTLPGGEIIIADTKWKRLESNPPTYGVSNADAYQMLAYSEVFQQGQPAPRLWLIYPRLQGLPEHPAPIRLPGGRSLSVVLLNLDQPDLFFPTSSDRSTADAPALESVLPS